MMLFREPGYETVSDLRPSLDPDYESVANNTNRMPGQSARADTQEPGIVFWRFFLHRGTIHVNCLEF